MQTPSIQMATADRSESVCYYVIAARFINWGKHGILAKLGETPIIDASDRLKYYSNPVFTSMCIKLVGLLKDAAFHGVGNVAICEIWASDPVATQNSLNTLLRVSGYKELGDNWYILEDSTSGMLPKELLAIAESHGAAGPVGSGSTCIPQSDTGSICPDTPRQGPSTIPVKSSDWGQFHNNVFNSLLASQDHQVQAFLERIVEKITRSFEEQEPTFKLWIHIQNIVQSSIDMRQGLKSKDDFIQSVTYAVQEYPGFLLVYEREESDFFKKYKLYIEDIIYFNDAKMAADAAAKATQSFQSTTIWQEYDGLMKDFIVSLPPILDSQEEEMEMLVEILTGMELDADE